MHKVLVYRCNNHLLSGEHVEHFLSRNLSVGFRVAHVTVHHGVHQFGRDSDSQINPNEVIYTFFCEEA